MPGGRSRRGGVRTGTPGKTYSQRTDLNANRTLPITAPTGLPYSQHKALVDTQTQVPIQAPGPPPGPTPTVSGGGPGPPAAAPAITPLSAPSNRPDEPITAGLPTGPGPGPEALGLGRGSGRLADIIAQAAAASGSSDLDVLAQRARVLGQ